MSAGVEAQEAKTTPRTTVFGASASGFISPYPHENIVAVGGLVGLEQNLSDRISIRALASLQRGFSSRSVGVCIPDELSGCLAVLLPYWLSSVEANAVAKPVRGFPVRFVVGAGYSIGSDAREARSGDRHSLPTETGFVIRGGLEVPLGRSPRAPRLQFTRAGFRPAPFSLQRVETLTFLLVR